MTINTKANVGDTIFAVYNDGYLRIIGPLVVSAIEIQAHANRESSNAQITYHARADRREGFKCEESVVYTTLDSAVGRYTELVMKAMEPKQA